MPKVNQRELAMSALRDGIAQIRDILENGKAGWEEKRLTNLLIDLEAKYYDGFQKVPTLQDATFEELNLGTTSLRNDLRLAGVTSLATLRQSEIALFCKAFRRSHQPMLRLVLYVMRSGNRRDMTKVA